MSRNDDWRSRLHPAQREIEQLMDRGNYHRAVDLAQRLKEQAPTESLRRRYHGLYLFALDRVERPEAKPTRGAG